MSTPRGMPQPGMRSMGDELRMVVRGESHAYRFLRWRLMVLVAGTLLLDAVATVLMYVLEHDESASGFHNWGGAAVLGHRPAGDSQLADAEAVTGAARVVDIVLEVWRSRSPRRSRRRWRPSSARAKSSTCRGSR